MSDSSENQNAHTRAPPQALPIHARKAFTYTKSGALNPMIHKAVSDRQENEELRKKLALSESLNDMLMYGWSVSTGAMLMIHDAIGEAVIEHPEKRATAWDLYDSLKTTFDKAHGGLSLTAEYEKVMLLGNNISQLSPDGVKEYISKIPDTIIAGTKQAVPEKSEPAALLSDTGMEDIEA